MSRAEHVACKCGEQKHASRVLVGILEERRSLGRHRRIKKDNFKIDLQKVVLGQGLD